ncbi:MAG: hypothetical protein A3D95_15920 [Betaproteobacteria bacterium RIFCSPHIGHO2_12_FULL_69_13]|nr:MAG: hypothetical protein A3D95_15920 [Betaproteobacteria bacterium RIFCSPHIGHO2_12_FULL_69_13]
MAEKSNAKSLTLKIEGARITADRFLKAVSAFVGLINEVSDTVTGEEGSFRWLVSVEGGSAIVHFKPESRKAPLDQAAASIRAVNNGLDLVERRAERPRFWSDAALRKAKDLADVLDVDDGALDRVSVQVNRSQVDFTRKLSAHVNDLVGAGYKSLGTIEGRLRTVTEAGGVHFVVQDPITNNSIRCDIEEEDVEKYLAAFRKRVSVYGEIRYRKDGQPVSIAVREFRVLRESHELPRAKDVKGILA